MTALPTTNVDNPVLPTVFDSLTSRRRRVILTILVDRLTPVAERELAAHVVATEQGTTLAEVTQGRTMSAHADLHHVQLPRLENATLIERRDDGVMARTDRIRELGMREIVQTWADGEPDDLDAVLSALGDHRRWDAVRILESRDGSLSIDELAEEMADRRDEDATAVRIALHHTHLPTLSETGLIDIDDNQLQHTGRSTALIDLLTVSWADRFDQMIAVESI